jgi:uncharacterized protein YndB with AHSA1/START domain
LPIITGNPLVAERGGAMEVTRELVVTAAEEDVWDALTDPERLAEWFANDVELEVARGGEGVFRWESGEVRRAVVDAVEERRRLSLRWWDEDEPSAVSLVTITLEEAGEGTRVRVVETAAAPFAAAEWATALELRFAFVLPEVRF